MALAGRQQDRERTSFVVVGEVDLTGLAKLAQVRSALFETNDQAL
ncbi:hypothetical protein [Streptomyces kronopolitis]